MRKQIIALAATAAMMTAAPALARPGAAGGPPAGVGGGMAGGGGIGMGAGAGGGAGAGMNMGLGSDVRELAADARDGGIGTEVRDLARESSRGADYANARALERANASSVLSTGTVVSGSLAGLTVGQSVTSTSGTALGTVSRIQTSKDGTVRVVFVTGANGRTYALAPSTLTLDGGVVVTTSTRKVAGR